MIQRDICLEQIHLIVSILQLFIETSFFSPLTVIVTGPEGDSFSFANNSITTKSIISIINTVMLERINVLFKKIIIIVQFP